MDDGVVVGVDIDFTVVGDDEVAAVMVVVVVVVLLLGVTVTRGLLLLLAILFGTTMGSKAAKACSEGRFV
jgi:hypothetical protein